MSKLPTAENQIQSFTIFEELISTPFHGKINAHRWTRKLVGDFSEIVESVNFHENIMVLEEDYLLALNLSEQGNLARKTILNDLKMLTAHGALPVLNLIKNYERDTVKPFFPTDVYSFHVDRSPIPTSTFLCTYYGESSQILPNAQGIKKVLVPEIREELKKNYNGPEESFEYFLREHFFDLHYEAVPDACPISLGIGNLWKLAVDHPDSKVLPCIHRAPIESDGQTRLLLIC